MEATAYLDSLSISYRPPAKTSVGRLSVIGEFLLDDLHGVIVRPRRGGVSGRYLDLLAAEGFGLVIVETQPFPQVYARTQNGVNLERIRALPINTPDQFPPADLFRLIPDLMRGTFRSGADSLVFGASLLLEKLDDEQGSEKRFGPALVSPQHSIQVSDLFRDANAFTEGLSAKGAEAVLMAAAVLSGYRVTPTTPLEAAMLIDGLAGFSRVSQQVSGLPESVAFAFTGYWTSGSQILVASQTLGCQFLALGNRKGIALLPPSLAGVSVLIRKIFSNCTVLNADFLDWFPDEAPDRIVLIPPVGGNAGSPSVSDRFTLANRDRKRITRMALEIFYIQHAIQIAAPVAIMAIVVPEGLLSNMSHADFRKWLLEQGRLLAVVSLPASQCFQGAAACCSILYFQKVQPVPCDYPILMMEIQEDDLLNIEARKELQKAIDDALAGELSG